jgi:purine-binding chemotaxis protein CheW
MVRNNKEAIFKARALALASGGIQKEHEQGDFETVLFSISNERYSIESIYIREVYTLKELTPLPCLPSFVMGVIQVRRKI